MPKFVNVDKKEAQFMGDPFGESIYDRGLRLLSFFNRSGWKSLGQLMEKHGINNRKKGVPCGLGRLEIPEDIIYMIFFHIEDAPTAFRFGVANTRLMMIGERRIKQLLGDRNWEGDRLIIVYDSDDDDDDDEGDDGDGNNDGVIKDEDSGNKDKDDGNKDKDDGDDDNEDGGDDGDEEDEDDGVEEDEDDGIDLPEGLDLGDLKHFTERADWRWSSILSRGLPSHTPEYRIAEDLATPLYVEILKPEVMWNLTKHVYVRSDAIPTNQELPDRWADWFDTGDEKEDMDNKMGWILLVHIIWTNYSLFNHKPDAFGGVFYGKWAGDRFEVTAKDVLETRLKETGCGWTDYSEEAVQLFIDVFNST